MAVSIESSATWGELERGVGVRFLEVFNQSTRSYSNVIDNLMTQEGNKATLLCKKMTTQDQVSHFIQKTGLAYPQIFSEGNAIPSDSRILGYKTSMTPQYQGSSVIVTQRAMKDRDYNQQLDEFRDLGVTMMEKMDRDFFANFNNAFTAQSSLPQFMYGYGDGKPFASTLHPRKDAGSAQSNASATGLTLTVDNLNTARNALLRQLDDRGKPVRVGSGKLTLLVPSELEVQAAEITKSVKRANTANNNVNVYDGIVTVIASKWLAETGTNGVTTQWHLLDPSILKLIFLLREGVQTHTATDANTLNKTFYTYGRWATGWTDWRGSWHSKGDGASYSS